MEFIELVLLTLNNGFYEFFLCFLAMESITFSMLIYIVGFIFQVGFNYKYGEHINTCEIISLVCEPMARVLLSF